MHGKLPSSYCCIPLQSRYECTYITLWAIGQSLFNRLSYCARQRQSQNTACSETEPSFVSVWFRRCCYGCTNGRNPERSFPRSTLALTISCSYPAGWRMGRLTRSLSVSGVDVRPIMHAFRHMQATGGVLFFFLLNAVNPHDGAFIVSHLL